MKFPGCISTLSPSNKKSSCISCYEQSIHTHLVHFTISTSADSTVSAFTANFDINRCTNFDSATGVAFPPVFKVTKRK